MTIRPASSSPIETLKKTCEVIFPLLGDSASKTEENEEKTQHSNNNRDILKLQFFDTKGRLGYAR